MLRLKATDLYSHYSHSSFLSLLNIKGYTLANEQDLSRSVHICVCMRVMCVCVCVSDREVEGLFLSSASEVFHLGHGLEGQPDWKAFWPWHLPSTPLLCHHFDSCTTWPQPGGEPLHLAAGGRSTSQRRSEKKEEGKGRENRKTRQALWS